MIRTSLSFLPLLYAGALLAGVLVLWLVGAWRRSRRRRRERRMLGQCRLCAAWVRPVTGADLWRCPECQALNERAVPIDL
jgi:hypothetical protein